MFKKSNKALSRMKWLMAATAVPVLSLLALFLMADPAETEVSAMYVVTEDAYVHVDELSKDVFVTGGAAELISYGSGNDIRLTGGQSVTITYGDEIVTATSYSETVTSLLRRMNIFPSPLEMVAVTFGDENVEIAVASEFVFYDYDTVVTPHEVLYEYNYQKPDWYEGVLQQGSDGVKGNVYEVFYQDGEETSRQLIDIIDTEPVPTIIEIGMLPNFANNGDTVSSIVTNEDGTGTITLENGQTVTFNQVRTMKGTAYTAGENAYVDSVTATGTLARVGVVAVDRKVLPLGTKVYVVSNDGLYQYGFAIAEDTGVRGNIIDLYMDTYDQCVRFGVRECTVYILD